MVKTKKIMFVCPRCKMAKSIEVPLDVFEKSNTGTTPVVVPEHVICEHEIHSYVDKNGAVRGYIQYEYNIMSMTARIQKIKQLAIAQYQNYFGRTNIQPIVEKFSAHDLLHLFECCFMRFPIIFIENEPEGNRFQLFYSLFESVYPKLAERVLIYSMSEYEELAKEENFESYCILNTTHHFLVKSPVTFDQSESVAFLMDKRFYEEYILFNNAIKHLERYGDFVAEMMPKTPKAIFKQLSKEKNKQPWLTIDIIAMIYSRNEFLARNHVAMWKNDTLLSSALQSLIPRQKEWDEGARKELEDMDQKLSKLKEGLWG